MPRNPKILFGRRLAEIRRTRGWSQEKLSLESGVARSYLGGVERGQRNIALVNICKLADALQVQAGELFVFSSAPEQCPSEDEELIKANRDQSS